MMKRNQSFWVVLTIILTNSIQAQNNNEVIKSIRQVYSDVNTSLANYEKYTVNIEGESSESGELAIFIDKGQIEKSILSFYGEMGKRNIELYYKNGKLVFMFDVISSYNQPIYLGDVKVVSKEESRYYLHNGKLIKYISPEKKESWGNDIPQLKDKVKHVKEVEEKVLSYFNNRLLADLQQYSGKTIEELLEDKPGIKSKIIELSGNNAEVITPLLATLAEVVEENGTTYSAFGEIAYGGSISSTFLVFDLLSNSIYIWYNLEGKVTVYGMNENYPVVFKNWVNKMK